MEIVHAVYFRLSLFLSPDGEEGRGHPGGGPGGAGGARGHTPRGTSRSSKTVKFGGDG